MADQDRITALEKQVAQMSQEIGILQDTHAVRCLQHKYGYYIDKCLYDEAVGLFTDDCEMHFLGGIYRGKKKACTGFIAGGIEIISSEERTARCSDPCSTIR